MGSRTPVFVVASAMAAFTAFALACSSSSNSGGSGGGKDSGSTLDAPQMMDSGVTTMDSEASTPSESGADAAPDASTSDAACNTGGADGGMCVAGMTPPYVSCANLTSPPVSYAASVQPVFNASCAIAGATCHGDPNTNAMATGQVYLGNEAGGADAGLVLMGLVGKPSAEDPQMDLVAPGDPAHSFLMHKLDGDQCIYAAQCNATKNPVFTNCGLQQPYNSGVLDLATRDAIRRWIAQGAQND